MFLRYDAVMDFKEYFEGKNITVMGLGLLGRGVGDTEFLAEMGAKLTVTDLKRKEELGTSLAQLTAFPDISYVLGEHKHEDFEGRDFILKAAGVPLDSAYIAHARASGVSVKMSAALFAQLSHVPMVGVTGTRGKSTVTHMIHHVLKESTDAVDTGGVLLGGNVRGVSNLALLRDVGPDSIAVCELDSWQLQGFGEEKISPQVAVFTSFMPDHMNYYHHDMEAYFGDKAQIFLHQDAHGALITTREVFEYAHGYARRHGLTIGGEVILTDLSAIPDSLMLTMPGVHNRMNAALATETLRALSLSDEEIFAGLSSFRGVPGRLEFMGERQGVKIWNDNNATTPDATVEGLRAVADGKNVVLIMGGADKGLDVEALLREVGRSAKEVIMLPGTGTERMRAFLPNAHLVADVAEALSRAIAASESGDSILFSPAFASFGLFANEYERNDAFVSAVTQS
jgi:UDP-N-acetylmuramoylalanine--D-glutamate ligase